MGVVTLLTGGLAGAALMYFFDPNMGRRRRALLRDQMVKLRNTTSSHAEVFAEQAAGRARGAVADTGRHLAFEEVSDETLVARVRSEMGRYVSHPRAVEVTAEGGVVTLTGNILALEVQPFVAKVKTMPGVRHVDNRLQVHESAGNIPDLQGGTTRTELL